ncbi:uncharacterized protein Z518_03959 [Rhinocladiella mackenziei CBS 650.93]|uniref:Copper-fist domain-containing protein n=1 Tax=Rhinocladiella mackenziei CBS 650.93 TaxID=1442369 RepID=A0A0D2JA43_9EURO|nr:uncharacterized protein Z518_03959 [Rhinocladiella mackenziei CBS 650.93]KIX05985.1 hypothetical protein Z518_03959 [Rhinocladiella mackenziei CBS 650.93]
MSIKRVDPFHSATIAEACAKPALSMSSANVMTKLTRKRIVLMKRMKGNLVCPLTTVPFGHKLTRPQESHTCCCQHGARCTCSLKKEHLDTVPEDIPQLIQPKEHHKQRLNMNSHDPKTTIFTNGHHKPVHKFNDAHNQLGNPYKIPSRSNSLHGHREVAQRSTDSLPLTKFAKPFHESPLHNSMTEAMDIVQRKVKSEHNSPVLGPQNLANPSIRDLQIPSFDPNAYSYSPFGTDTPNSLQNSQNASQQDLTLPERFPEAWFMTYEQAHEYEPPPGSKYNEIDWSTFNLDGNGSVYNTDKANSPYLSQQVPHQAIDLSNQISQAGITSSSGEASEVEDLSPPSNRWGNDRSINNDRQSGVDNFNDLSSIGGDDASDRYRLSSASSYYGTPQANLLAGDNIASLDIDDFLKQAEAETKRMQLQQQMAQMQMASQEPPQPSRLSSASRGMTPNISTPGSTGNGEHPYTISEAQRYAHMDGMSNDPVVQPKPAMPASSMADDPSWSAAPDMSNPELTLDDEREDEDWVR